jgi:hypothetical protein
MAPKQTAHKRLKDAKPDKKRGQMKKNGTTICKEEDCTTEKTVAGKNQCNNPVQTKDIASLKKETLYSEYSDDIQKTNKAQFSNLQLNKLIQKKSMLSIAGAVSWKIFLFPSLLEQLSIPKKTQQYFGLDLIEEVNERTYWTHKPSIWHEIFVNVIQMAKTGDAESISDMFNGTLSCPVRATPNGTDEEQTETFKSAKGQIIQHWIMVVPMPPDIDCYEYIQEFIHQFQGLWKKHSLGMLT